MYGLRRPFIEDFAPYTLKDLRKALGGAKHLNRTEMVIIDLADGRKQAVRLIAQQTHIGEQMRAFECPTCRRTCRVLRVVPSSPALACRICVQGDYGARYRSQVVRRLISKMNVLPTVEVVDYEKHRSWS